MGFLRDRVRRMTAKELDEDYHRYMEKRRADALAKAKAKRAVAHLKKVRGTRKPEVDPKPRPTVVDVLHVGPDHLTIRQALAILLTDLIEDERSVGNQPFTDKETILARMLLQAIAPHDRKLKTVVKVDPSVREYAVRPPQPDLTADELKDGLCNIGLAVLEDGLLSSVEGLYARLLIGQMAARNPAIGNRHWERLKDLGIERPEVHGAEHGDCR